VRINEQLFERGQLTMSGRFNQSVARMSKLLKDLKRKPFLTRDNLYNIPKQGVYVFYHDDKPIYVGRSNNLKLRIQQHGRPSSRHNSASLAFNIANEMMERNGQIPKFITRKEREEAPGFDRAFFLARITVAKMKIRVIEITDQIDQAMFEIYAVLALNTRYNDFSTH